MSSTLATVKINDLSSQLLAFDYIHHDVYNSIDDLHNIQHISYQAYSDCVSYLILHTFITNLLALLVLEYFKDHSRLQRYILKYLHILYNRWHQCIGVLPSDDLLNKHSADKTRITHEINKDINRRKNKIAADRIMASPVKNPLNNHDRSMNKRTNVSAAKTLSKQVSSLVNKSLDKQADKLVDNKVDIQSDIERGTEVDKELDRHTMTNIGSPVKNIPMNRQVSSLMNNHTNTDASKPRIEKPVIAKLPIHKQMSLHMNVNATRPKSSSKYHQVDNTNEAYDVYDIYGDNNSDAGNEEGGDDIENQQHHIEDNGDNTSIYEENDHNLDTKRSYTSTNSTYHPSISHINTNTVNDVNKFVYNNRSVDGSTKSELTIISPKNASTFVPFQSQFG